MCRSTQLTMHVLWCCLCACRARTTATAPVALATAPSTSMALAPHKAMQAHPWPSTQSSTQVSALVEKAKHQHEMDADKAPAAAAAHQLQQQQPPLLLPGTRGSSAAAALPGSNRRSHPHRPLYQQGAPEAAGLKACQASSTQITVSNQQTPETAQCSCSNISTNICAMTSSRLSQPAYKACSTACDMLRCAALCRAVLCCAVLCCAGTSICGQCVKYRGKGQGLGGNPFPTDWQVRDSSGSMWY